MDYIQQQVMELRLEVAGVRYRLYGQVLTRAERQQLLEELIRVSTKLDRFERYIRRQMRV